MRPLIVFFMALAGLGFLVSLIAHLMALAGRLPPGGDAIMFMHGGVFVVWLPAVLAALRLSGPSEPGSNRRHRTDWNRTFAGNPAWMRYATHAVMLYAVLNFLLAMRGAPTHRGANGITPQILRGFSGHWMVFYWTGFAILYSAFREPWRLRARRCPSGHSVRDTDRHCPTCGAAVSVPSKS